MSSFSTFVSPGAGALSEYMISGIPWVTSSQVPASIVEINFKLVIKVSQLPPNLVLFSYVSFVPASILISQLLTYL